MLYRPQAKEFILEVKFVAPSINPIPTTLPHSLHPSLLPSLHLSLLSSLSHSIFPLPSSIPSIPPLSCSSVLPVRFSEAMWEERADRREGKMGRGGQRKTERWVDAGRESFKKKRHRSGEGREKGERGRDKKAGMGKD